jgi:thiamine-monophosphate kinase
VPRLRDVGEFEAIRRLTAGRGAGAGVMLGSGDDAAVLRPTVGMDLVATTDTFVEGRHWLPEWISETALGARLAVANLSDLAAMAATPRWALLSIGARPESELDALIAVQQGLERSLSACGATIVGGNLTGVEGAEWLSLTLLGEVNPGQAWTRAGGRAGDLVAVSGAPGRAGAGARLARALGGEARVADFVAVIDAWIQPRARTSFALRLATTGAVRAAVDLSDGIAGDLSHLCTASGVGAELDERAWPDDPALARAAEVLRTTVSDLRLAPSDDYELLLAVDPAERAACERLAREEEVPLAFIGRLTEAAGVLSLLGGDGRARPLPGDGYDHFRGLNDRAT